MEKQSIDVALRNAIHTVRALHSAYATLDILRACAADMRLDDNAHAIVAESDQVHEILDTEYELNRKVAESRTLKRLLAELLPTHKTYEALSHPLGVYDEHEYQRHVDAYSALLLRSAEHYHPQAYAVTLRLGSIACTAALRFVADRFHQERAASEWSVYTTDSRKRLLRQCPRKLALLWRFSRKAFYDMAEAHCRSNGATRIAQLDRDVRAVVSQCLTRDKLSCVPVLCAEQASQCAEPEALARQFYSALRMRSILGGDCFYDPSIAHRRIVTLCTDALDTERAFFEACFFEHMRIAPEHAYIAEQVRRECFATYMTEPIRALELSASTELVDYVLEKRDLVELCAIAEYHDTEVRVLCEAHIAGVERERATDRVSMRFLLTSCAELCATLAPSHLPLAQSLCAAMLNYCSRCTERDAESCLDILERSWLPKLSRDVNWTPLYQAVDAYVHAKKNIL